MPNPTTLRWNGPTAYTDGSAFGQSDLAGFEIQVAGRPAVVVPAAWNTENNYAFELAQLGLPYGSYTVALATVARNGSKSVPSEAVTSTLVDERVPNPPTSLSVA